jgi:putative DNA primase/helicase
MLQDALVYAQHGFAVFPLSPFSKIPLPGTTGVKEATTDQDQIRKWWMQCPRANIGVALGKISGVVAIDLDTNHGATKEDFRKFPRTLTVKTRNGWHLYYKYPGEHVKNHVVLPARDPQDKSAAAYLRTDGYYVVGAGSIVRHDDGHEWEYDFHGDAGGPLDLSSINPADTPDFCVAAQPKQVATPSSSDCLPPETRSYGPNTRHDMFKRTAAAMRRRGESAENIRSELVLRNRQDCLPPKSVDDRIEQELDGIVKWTMEHVEPVVLEGEYVLPLGYRGDEFFYTSSSNKFVISARAGGHSANFLFSLMPYEYWQSKYPGKEPGSIGVARASSDLMEACRDAGPFAEGKIRGVGCWPTGNGLVIHLGDKLWLHGANKDLGDMGDGYIYPIAPGNQLNDQAATVQDCRALLEACAAPTWQHPSYGKLLAGGLAVLRLCGALPWRPMFWLTGASGTGKSTLMEWVIQPMAGEWAEYIQGATTEAGIRQALKWDSRPVIFDEAETTDERSARRIKNLMELIRQGSSNSGGKILKGTPSGNGLNFRVNSSFLLSSIRVNLSEEADINRFCLLELDRGKQEEWPEVKRKLAMITMEYGDKIFRRMIDRWTELMASRAVFEEAVSKQENRRRGQQYGIILAGYWMLSHESAPSQAEATKLANELLVTEAINGQEHEADEREALNQLLNHITEHQDQEISLEKLIILAKSDSVHHEKLGSLGLDVEGDRLYVMTSHDSLKQIYRDTKWTGMWNNALSRLPGANRVRHYFGMRQLRCVSIPLDTLFHS